jgi:hypothetical protein
MFEPSLQVTKHSGIEYILVDFQKFIFLTQEKATHHLTATLPQLLLTLCYTPNVCTNPDHFKALYLQLACSKKIAGFLSNCSFLCMSYVEILTQCKLIVFF